jgi:two-component system, NarL family, response regulator LiaR
MVNVLDPPNPPIGFAMNALKPLLMPDGANPPLVRVLLADDLDKLRRVIVNFLEEEGPVRVVGEASGFKELLRKVAELKPRVVLMDVHMRDEWSVTPDYIKSVLMGSAERVLAMSLYTDNETRELSLSYGATLLLDKSKLCAELIPAIKKLCTDQDKVGTSIARLRSINGAHFYRSSPK